MSVLFAEGFTGIARGTDGFPGTNVIANMPNHRLYKLGWAPFSVYNGTSVGSSTAQVIIEADPVFGDRNRMDLKKNSPGGWTWLQFMTQALDTSRHDKFVIGFMCQTINTDVAAGRGISVAVFDGNAQTTLPTNAATTPANLLCRFRLPNDGAPGVAMSAAGTETTTSDQLKVGVDVHYEILIETDVQRLRAYANGILVLDVPYTGAFKSRAGFALGMWTGTNSVDGTGTVDMKFSNVYALGIDTVHTGKLGPATRILEMAPPSDKTVEWNRPDGFASNAAVLQQLFDNASPKFLSTGGPAKDLYTGFDAVAANAGELYGVSFRVRAQTMADGTHLLKGLVSSGTSELESANAATLQLANPANFSFDASVNPATGQKWTISQLTTAGIGMKLTQ